MPPSRPREANRSRYAILGALTLRPMSGYDLRRFFEDNLAFFWSESFGQIYPMLHALEEEGLVTLARGADERRRPYRITPSGRAALAAWLTLPAQLEVPRIEILLKLFYGSNAPTNVAREQVRRFRAVQEERKAEYALVQARLDKAPKDHPQSRYWMATLAFGMRTVEAMLAFCDDAEALLPVELAEEEGQPPVKPPRPARVSRRNTTP